MTSVAVQVLHQDLGAVWLETHTIVSVVDDGVLNDDVLAPVRIPSIRILRLMLTLTVSRNGQAVEDL